MPRKSLPEIIEKIKLLLEKEEELSIRQIAVKSKCQWRTAAKALQLMKNLGIVEERQGNNSKRYERLFRLIK